MAFTQILLSSTPFLTYISVLFVWVVALETKKNETKKVKREREKEVETHAQMRQRDSGVWKRITVCKIKGMSNGNNTTYNIWREIVKKRERQTACLCVSMAAQLEVNKVCLLLSSRCVLVHT